tara:strand:- start:404 stop:667 length:264 start_codon:yes stop_codon:yes gene_type:complete
MKAKLTLSIDENIIATAKEVARESGISLSQIIETHLLLMSNRKKKDRMAKKEPSITDKLRGSIKLDDDRDYREIVAEEMMKKYERLK